MKEDIIFIHVPKTGGTTINSAMNGQFWQSETGFNYRHILKQKKTSNAGDIFKAENIEKYKAYKIFMMLRDPVDRAISEYHFLRERKEFINLLSKPPESLEHYVGMTQTQNYMLGFLLGRRIYTTKSPTEDELQDVIHAIDEIPIHVGIFEHFQESLGYFNDTMGIEWKKKMEAKRMTFKRPKVDEIPESLKQLIREKNHLDQALYDHCYKKFQPLIPKYGKYNVQFELSKYNHIFPYMSRTNLFQFCMDNQHYMNQNFEYFKALNFHLIKTKYITQGESLILSWNQSLLNAIRSNFGEGEFTSVIQSAIEQNSEPLDQLIAVANAIDEFFSADPKGRKKFYTPMNFSLSDVKIIEQKSGFFKKLFGK